MALTSCEPEVPKASQKEASGQRMVYFYIHNANQGKYGTVLKHKREQNFLGTNQFPKPISRASYVLSNHFFHDTKGKNNNNDPNCN